MMYPQIPRDALPEERDAMILEWIDSWTPYELREPRAFVQDFGSYSDEDLRHRITIEPEVAFEPYTDERVREFTRAVREQQRRARSDVMGRNSCAPAFSPRSGIHSVDPRPGQLSAVNALSEALLDKTKGVAMGGPPGGGKTYLASAWVRSLEAAGETVEFIAWADLVNDERKRMDKSGPVGLLERATEAPRLALDDAGLATRTDYENELLCYVLDHRYRAGGQTVLTMNGFPDDERLQHRIRSMCALVGVGAKEGR